jgi:DNA-binding response OmpR family regulator
MGKTPRVLVADDNLHHLWLTQMQLELHGYEVLLATDGQMALRTTIAEQPDLIILDVEMPVMDGYAACQRIRSISDVPIIMLSARAQDKDRVRGLDTGADYYLTKPCAMQELLARVEALLRRVQYAIQLPPQTSLAGSASPSTLRND